MLDKADHTAVLTAATVATTAPLVLGDYAVIATAAVFGAAVAATRLSEASRAKTAWFIFRSVSITTFSAGLTAKFLASKWLSDRTGFSLEHSFDALAFVAFWMAVVGDGWFKVKDAIFSRLMRKIDAGSR